MFYGGGKLAPDLSVPRLLRRWQPGAVDDEVDDADSATGQSRHGGRALMAGGSSHARPAPTDRYGLTDLERNQVWQTARTAAARAAEHITNSAAVDADAAWAASDFLFGAAPVPTPAGRALRQACRLCSASTWSSAARRSSFTRCSRS